VDRRVRAPDNIAFELSILTLTPQGWGIAHDKKQKFEVNSSFKSVTVGFLMHKHIPYTGNMKRQWYLSYLVFDQQKIRYYAALCETYLLRDAELRF
jgi:hypothetical protein